MKESGLLGEMADSETGQDIHKISLDHPVVPESRSTQKKKKKKIRIGRNSSEGHRSQ